MPIQRIVLSWVMSWESIVWRYNCIAVQLEPSGGSSISQSGVPSPKGLRQPISFCNCFAENRYTKMTEFGPRCVWVGDGGRVGYASLALPSDPPLTLIVTMLMQGTKSVSSSVKLTLGKICSNRFDRKLTNTSTFFKAIK